MVDVKVFGNGQEDGYVQSIKFVASGNDRMSPESLGLNTYGNSQIMAGESIEQILVQPNQVILGFYGIRRSTDGRLKCIGLIYEDLDQ